MGERGAEAEALHVAVGLHPAQRAVVRTLCQVIYAGASTEAKLRSARGYLELARRCADEGPPLWAEALTAIVMAEELAEIARFARLGIGRG